MMDRSLGVAGIAKEAGLGRESLYKALSPGAKPRLLGTSVAVPKLREEK